MAFEKQSHFFRTFSEWLNYINISFIDHFPIKELYYVRFYGDDTNFGWYDSFCRSRINFLSKTNFFYVVTLFISTVVKYVCFFIFCALILGMVKGYLQKKNNYYIQKILHFVEYNTYNLLDTKNVLIGFCSFFVYFLCVNQFYYFSDMKA